MGHRRRERGGLTGRIAAGGSVEPGAPFDTRLPCSLDIGLNEYIPGLRDRGPHCLLSGINAVGDFLAGVVVVDRNLGRHEELVRADVQGPQVNDAINQGGVGKG